MNPNPIRAGGARRLPAGLTCTRIQPQAPIRLVCFAHAGGSPAAFRNWPAALAPDAEVWTVTLPGRAGRVREPFATDWPPLVEEIAEVLAGQVSAPLVLFGHSLGALLAFEVARALTRNGTPPRHLVASGRVAPTRTIVPPAVPGDDRDLVELLDVHYGGVPDQVRALPELLAHFLPIARADLELLRGYRYRPAAPLPCPIASWIGESDPDAAPERLRPWAFETTARFTERTFPGGHFYLRDHEQSVLDAVADLLDEDASGRDRADRGSRATAV
ncbi:thioesterase II family protein [Nocardia sp. NPDC049526]|uniref:thioesterase II family protein n=1 Tax=Nocardia sp. NPDC049526 TaxID=3364316 RepID=UPI003789C1E1